MGRPKRSTALKTEALRNRAVAWDQLAPGEISFDFSSYAANSPVPPELASTTESGEENKEEDKQERPGIKEAILRWLDEQI